MLDKELDKLRDKTLSFGCVIFEKSWGDVNYHRITTVKKQDNGEYTCECGGYEIFDISEYNIIGHPITRGRIEHIYNNHVTEQTDGTVDEYEKINGQIREIVLMIKGFDQSELERQTHEKRPELKELLLNFSNYL